jgi:hypothetical protein
LENAYKNKDAVVVEYGKSIRLFDDELISTDKYVEVLRKLLNENWHYRHEDIASILQGIKSPKSIEALYTAALSKFEHLNQDESK